MNLGLQNKVKIISFISNPHIILKNLIYILIAYYEGQSNSVLEALYYNVPVLSADNDTYKLYKNIFMVMYLIDLM